MRTGPSSPTPFEVTMHDKLGALDKLMRYLGLYKELLPLESLLVLLPHVIREAIRAELAEQVATS